MVGWESFIIYLSAALPAFILGLLVGRNRNTKEGTPSTSHNSVSREIKCSNRECDFRNKNGVCTNKIGPFCSDRSTSHPA